MSKNKRKKKGNKFYKFIGILLIIASIALFGITLFVEILGLKELAIAGGILLLLNLIVNFFLFRKRVKKKPKKIFTVIAILFIILFSFATYFIFKTYGTINDMSMGYKFFTYNVLVKNDSSYQVIEDIEGKRLGYYNDNSDSSSKAQTKLSSRVKTENEGYGNLESLGKALLEGDQDAILLEKSDNDMLNKAGNNSDSSVGGFETNTRVIYTFKVWAKINSKDVNVTKEVFNVYISGMDEYGKVKDISRSDVNMILTINPKTKQMLITNIPRDYYVQLHDTTGYKDKLTHAGTYGIETSVETLEDLLGIDINYYFKVNFSSLGNIIDALGGVEVYSEYDFQSWNGYNFQKGYNEIEDGKAGLAFVRERHAFQDGDNQRGKNQQAMIDAIFRKCTSPSIIIKYNALLNSLKDSMITNMPTKSMTKLAKMQLRTDAKWSITSQSLTGTGDSNYTYTLPGQLLYVMVPDEESVNAAKEQIAKVKKGEKLESSYASSSSDIKSVTKSNVSHSSYTSSSTATKKKNTKTVVKKQTPKKSTTTAKTNTKSSEPTPTEPVETTPTEEPTTPTEEPTEPVEPTPTEPSEGETP